MSTDITMVYILIFCLVIIYFYSKTNSKTFDEINVDWGPHQKGS